MVNERGPHFIIVHAWQAPGTFCSAGEEIAAVKFMARGRGFQLDIGVGPRILFDFMARNRLPRGASLLAAGLNADAFSTLHGANSPTGRKRTRKAFTHSALKVYVERIR